MKNKSVMGVVDDLDQANYAVAQLQQQGFSSSDISMLFPDTGGVRDFGHEQHTKAPEGAAIGAGAGGLIGGALGLLMGIGTIAIPGLGALVAAGPLLAMLSGLGAGATVGGVGGLLAGLGVPEVQAKLYEGKIHAGNILLAVHVPTRDAKHEAKECLERAGARDIHVIGEASVPRRDEERVSR